MGCLILHRFLTYLEAVPGFIGDVILVSCAITGAVCAVLGLRTWRAQLHGTSDYEHARNLLRTTFRYRDAFRAARSPFSSYSKGEGEEDVLAGSTVESWNQHLVRDLDRRWNILTEARSALDAEILEATVLWGPDARDEFKPLDELEQQLFVAFLHKHDSLNPDDPEPLEPGESRKLRKQIYEQGPDDPVRLLLENTVKSIEQSLRGRLKPPVW